MGSMILIAYEEDISYYFFNSYDTSIPSYIIMVFFVVMVSAIVISSTGGMFKYFGNNRQRKRLLVQGREAEALVLSLDEASDGTITTINDQPLVTLELEIRDGNKPPYKVKLEKVISRLDIPKLQPGKITKVKVDPNDPNKVILI